MTLSGWLVMIASVGSVLAVFLWCLWKVISIPVDPDHLHGFESQPPEPE